MDTVLHCNIFQAVLHEHGRQVQMLLVLTCELHCTIWMFSSTFTFTHWNFSRHHHTEKWTTFMQFLINTKCMWISSQIFNRNIHVVIAENNIMHICIFFIWKSKWHVHSCIELTVGCNTSATWLHPIFARALLMSGLCSSSSWWLSQEGILRCHMHMLVQNLLMDVHTQILSTGWKFYSHHYISWQPLSLSAMLSSVWLIMNW